MAPPGNEIGPQKCGPSLFSARDPQSDAGEPVSYEPQRGLTMAIRELSEAEFQAVFTRPMRRLGIQDTLPVRLNLNEYVTEAIDSLALPTSSANIEIHYVFVAQDESFTHVNFSWGVENVFLVIVIDNRHEAIHGHRILDLNNLYGLS